MNNNEQSFPIQNKDQNNEKNELEVNNIKNKNMNNSIPENIQNLNQLQNLQNNNEKEKELEDQDGTDNLRYISNNYNNNINFYIQQQRLDSCDSAAPYKFSIDLPNVPKQRLHEFLNDDLLNELDYNSPNIPNLNAGLTNNKKLSISNENNDNNNPNNLFDFSLYPKLNDNNNKNGNINNQNKMNTNINQNMNYNIQDYNFGNNFNNMNINNNYNNTFYFNNFQNFNYMNNNMNNLNFNMNNPQIYVPTKLRNKDQIDKKELIYGQKNQQYNNKKEDQNNAKNKFDNNKKTGQNSKKDKNKKHFEIRAGDWTCNKCNNLNFSFRNKCNRCGLPKELNKKIEPMMLEVFGQNPNYQVMNGINTNIFYGNANVNNINNTNA